MHGDDPARRFLGQQVGPYQVTGLLGRGGMGVVLRARQLNLGRDVALKLMLGGQFASPELRTRFVNEARLMARLQHTGLLQIFDVGVHQGFPYYSMALVQGTSLKDALPRMSHVQAANVLGRVAQTLDYIHQHGLIHRDIKPDNILLNQEGLPLLMDFGLAKDLGDEGGLTVEGSTMGTPAFMSPEQAGGETERIDHRTDIYALGAVLYVALARTAPFQGATPLNVVSKVLRGPPPPPSEVASDVPPALERICQRAMARDPEDRYQQGEHLAADLLAFARGEHQEPAEERAPPRQRVSSRSRVPVRKRQRLPERAPGRRSVTPWVAAGGVGLCLVAGAFALRGGSKPRARLAKSEASAKSERPVPARKTALATKTAPVLQVTKTKPDSPKPVAPKPAEPKTVAPKPKPVAPKPKPKPKPVGPRTVGPKPAELASHRKLLAALRARDAQGLAALASPAAEAAGAVLRRARARSRGGKALARIGAKGKLIAARADGLVLELKAGPKQPWRVLLPWGHLSPHTLGALAELPSDDSGLRWLRLVAGEDALVEALVEAPLRAETRTWLRANPVRRTFPELLCSGRLAAAQRLAGTWREPRRSYARGLIALFKGQRSSGRRLLRKATRDPAFDPVAAGLLPDRGYSPMPLSGRAILLPDGRTRVEYRFDDPAEKRDWFTPHPRWRIEQGTLGLRSRWARLASRVPFERLDRVTVTYRILPNADQPGHLHFWPHSDFCASDTYAIWTRNKQQPLQITWESGEAGDQRPALATLPTAWRDDRLTIDLLLGKKHWSVRCGDKLVKVPTPKPYRVPGGVWSCYARGGTRLDRWVGIGLIKPAPHPLDWRFEDLVDVKLERRRLTQLAPEKKGPRGLPRFAKATIDFTVQGPAKWERKHDDASFLILPELSGPFVVQARVEGAYSVGSPQVEAGLAVLRADGKYLMYPGNGLMMDVFMKNWRHVFAGPERRAGGWWLRVRRVGVYYWLDRSFDGKTWEQAPAKGPIVFAGGAKGAVRAAFFVATQKAAKARFRFARVQVFVPRGGRQRRKRGR